MRIEEIRRQNLIWLIEQEYQGVDVNLARALGVQASQISRVFSNNPTHRRNIGRGLAEKIEERSGKPDGWMDLVHEFVDYSTNGARPRHAVRSQENGMARTNVASGPTIKRVVPLITWQQAGHWPEPDGEQPSIQGKYLCPLDCSEHTFVLKVQGASMEPRFRDGELIFVDPVLSPEHGKFVVVSLEPDATPVFRQWVEEGDRRYLQALNEDWPERVIALKPTARCIGVVIFKGEAV